MTARPFSDIELLPDAAGKLLSRRRLDELARDAHSRAAVSVDGMSARGGQVLAFATAESSSPPVAWEVRAAGGGYSVAEGAVFIPGQAEPALIEATAEQPARGSGLLAVVLWARPLLRPLGHNVSGNPDYWIEQYLGGFVQLSEVESLSIRFLDPDEWFCLPAPILYKKKDQNASMSYRPLAWCDGPAITQIAAPQPMMFLGAGSNYA